MCGAPTDKVGLLVLVCTCHSWAQAARTELVGVASKSARTASKSTHADECEVSATGCNVPAVEEPATGGGDGNNDNADGAETVEDNVAGDVGNARRVMQLTTAQLELELATGVAGPFVSSLQLPYRGTEQQFKALPFVAALELTRDQVRVCSLAARVFDPSSQVRPFLGFLGFWIGDGFMEQESDGRWLVGVDRKTHHDDLFVAWVLRKLDLVGHLRGPFDSTTGKVRWQLDKPSWAHFFLGHYAKSEVDATQHDCIHSSKELPAFAYELPADLARHVIAGLHLADGHSACDKKADHMHGSHILFDKKCLYTASHKFRDQVWRACA
jgi:hypothetical protein